MAVVEMQKIKILALNEDYNKIAELLTKSHSFETKKSEHLLKKPDNSLLVSEIETLRARLIYAIEYLAKEDYKYSLLKEKPDLGFNYTPIKTQSVRPIISPNTLFDIRQKEKELNLVVDQINKISYLQNDITHQKQKIKEQIEQYKEYISFPYNFNQIIDTEQTFSLVLGASSNAKLPQFDLDVCIEEFSSEKNKVIIITALKEDREQILSALNEKGFTKCPFSGDLTIEKVIKQSIDKYLKKDRESISALSKALALTDKLDELKILYDYYGIMLERYNLDGVTTTDYVTLLEGWCPKEHTKTICQKLSDQIKLIYFDIQDPDKNDTPPTLLKNNKLIQPFEDITSMYTVPNYTDSDPNLFMSIWFFFLFGIMVGDVIYGLFISTACFLLLKLKKMETGMSRLVKVFGFCGISSIIWGIIFGSFLGFSLKVNSNFFFSFSVMEDGQAINYFGWFSPMEQPIKLLAVAIIVGMCHLLFAFSIKAALLIKDKKPVSALFDSGLNMLVVISIFFLGANIFAFIFKTGQLALDAKVFSDSTSKMLSNIGMSLLLIGIIGLFTLSGRESFKNKKIGGWLGSGFNGIYNGIIGVVSDILSYSRLFGLGLAGAAIGFAFNTLVNTVFFDGSVVKTIIGSVLLLLLHIFNIAISLLGTYVHNARLQFLEYYGKFLTGDGKAFEPLGEKTRFIRLKK